MNTFIDLKNRYILRGILQGEEGLHIGTGMPSVDTDAPFIRQGNRPFIPGSSLRGAMRSTVERMVRSLWGPGACCSLFCEPDAGNECWASDKVKRTAIESATSYGDELRRNLVAGNGKLCAVCQLFGSTVMAARLKVTDAVLKKDQEPVRRDGVGIDRDTETAADKIKYDFEVLDKGCEFDFSLYLENASDADLGLLYILVKELEHGMDVGGKKVRGLGRLLLIGYEVHYFDETWGLERFLSDGPAREGKIPFERRLRAKFDAIKVGGPNG